MRKRRNGPCQGSGWKMNPKQSLAFPSQAAAEKYAREHGLVGYSIRRMNPSQGRGGKATGAGAGGAGGGAGAGSQGGASRTEVRSPTRTSTSTKAKTTGNITVTGGAGRGATTSVTIRRNPGTEPANADMVRFIKQVLANDESSSDRELLDHFVSQGVQPAIAKSWIAKRSQYLRGERNPLPVGKLVTVLAKRLPGGRVVLRGIR